MLPGWRRSGCSCEQAGRLAMPKRVNQDMGGDHSPALYQSDMRMRKIQKILSKDEHEEQYKGLSKCSAPGTPPLLPKGTQPSDTRSPEESKKAGNADFH